MECLVMYDFTTMLCFSSTFGQKAVTIVVSPYLAYSVVIPSYRHCSSLTESVIMNFFPSPEASLMDRGFTTPRIVY